MPTPMRILLTATPRSGNTWLCRMLGGVYRMHWLATHALGEAEWAAMPAEVVCQSHWPRTPGLAARAAAEGFRVLTLARHPLDVLISVLHFARHEPQTRFWLGGAGGDERAIHAARPRDWAFREYATGPRAAALLNVTASWWGRPGVVTVRYEDLVRDPRAALRALADSLGEPPRGDLGGVVAANSLAAARAGEREPPLLAGPPRAVARTAHRRGGRGDRRRPRRRLRRPRLRLRPRPGPRRADGRRQLEPTGRAAPAQLVAA